MKTGNATLNKSIPWNVRIHNNLIKKEKDMLLSIETKYDKAKYDERCLLYKEDILRYVAIIIDLNKKATLKTEELSIEFYTTSCYQRTMLEIKKYKHERDRDYEINRKRNEYIKYNYPESLSLEQLQAYENAYLCMISHVKFITNVYISMRIDKENEAIIDAIAARKSSHKTGKEWYWFLQCIPCLTAKEHTRAYMSLYNTVYKEFYHLLQQIDSNFIEFTKAHDIYIYQHTKAYYINTYTFERFKDNNTGEPNTPYNLHTNRDILRAYEKLLYHEANLDAP